MEAAVVAEVAVVVEAGVAVAAEAGVAVAAAAAAEAELPLMKKITYTKI